MSRFEVHAGSSEAGFARSATNALTTAAISIVQLGLAISLAALIFAGPLSSGAGRAATGFVLGTAIVSAVVGYRSSMSIVIAGAQDTPAIVIAAVAASISTAPGISTDEQIPTVLVMIALCGLATGAAFWAVGRYGFGSFVRFLPYPVISGFTAGTGWLLFSGGIEVMLRRPIPWGEFDTLLTWDEAKFLVPGLVLGLVMVGVVLSRLTNTIVGVAILASAVLFHVIGRSSSSLDTLEADGWLIGPLDTAERWAPIRARDLRDTNWGVLFDNVLPIVAVVVVSLVGILLNLSGLESGPDRKIEIDQELRSSGAANLAVGATGGLIGYHLLGDTVLARQLGARGRSVPIAVALFALGAFFAGADLIALVPRSVAGGVLTGLGLTLLVEWGRTSLTQLNRVDDLLSALILISIAVLGVLTGVTAGVLVAAAVFVVRYSRIDPVRHVLDAAGRSNVDRHQADREALLAASGSVLAFELQGYLFFGSTTHLRNQIDEVVAKTDRGSPCRFVVVDFAHVTGIDTTAATGLAKIAADLDEQGVETLWSNARSNLRHDLEREPGLPPLHRDLDHAIAWCEQQLLSKDSDHRSPADEYLEDALSPWMSTRELSRGETLIESGGADRDMYFVDSGKFTAWIDTDDGRRVRIRQVLPGAALGEIAFCTGAPRTATVIADSDAVVRVLSRARFEDLVATDPHKAIEIQQDLLRRMGDRVASTSSMVRDLLR